MLKFFGGLALGLVLGIGGTFAAILFIGIMAQGARARAIAPVAEQNRRSSTASTLQTLRGQTELFKIQHADQPPAPGALAVVLSGKTNANDISTINPMGTYGPYVQQFPANPENGKSAVGSAPSPQVGWVYSVNGGEYNLQAVNAAGTDVLPY